MPARSKEGKDESFEWNIRIRKKRRRLHTLTVELGLRVVLMVVLHSNSILQEVSRGGSTMSSTFPTFCLVRPFSKPNSCLVRHVRHPVNAIR